MDLPDRRQSSQLVYITATDSQGLKGQIPFQLNINGLPPVDAAPAITKLKVRPKTMTLANAKKNRAKVKLTLSEAAKVKFKAKRTKPKRPNASKKFGKGLDAGKQRLRLKSKKLPPGKYKLIARATDGGGLRSKKATTKFKIVKR